MLSDHEAEESTRDRREGIGGPVILMVADAFSGRIGNEQTVTYGVTTPQASGQFTVAAGTPGAGCACALIFGGIMRRKLKTIC